MNATTRNYWRMQLHPNDAANAVRHSVESLSAGFIGLDFREDVGDLMTLRQNELPTNQEDYWAFAHEMAVGDVVLIMAHHFPLAICRVAGDYNYIRHHDPDIGVWFRHFRRADQIAYYGDFVTNAHDWANITMTTTVSPLRTADSQSRQLIDAWIADQAK